MIISETAVRPPDGSANASNIGTVISFLVKTSIRDAQFPAASQDGFTPLHFAAERGRVDVVRQLVKSGANIEATANRVRNTAAHHRLGHLRRSPQLNLRRIQAWIELT